MEQRQIGVLYRAQGEGGVYDWEVAGPGMADETYVYGANAGNGNASGFVCGKDANGAWTTNTTSAAVVGLTEANAKVVYGWSRRGDNVTSDGVVGEAFAFDRVLTANETAMITAYLQNKWQDSSFAVDKGEFVWTKLGFVNGKVNLAGASATIQNLAASGTGEFLNATAVVVTGNISASQGATITVNGDLDLSSATITPDNSWMTYESVMTITATGTLTGTPTLQLASGETRRFKVRKRGNTISLTLNRPGLLIYIR